MRLFELFPSRPPNGKFEAARSLLFSSLSQVRESVDDSIAVSVYVIMRVFIKSYFFYQSFSIFVIYFLALSCRRDFSAITYDSSSLSLSLPFRDLRIENAHLSHARVLFNVRQRPSN